MLPIVLIHLYKSLLVATLLPLISVFSVGILVQSSDYFGLNWNAAATIGSTTVTDSYPDDLRTADSHDSTFLKPVSLESKARTQTFILGGRNHSVMKLTGIFYNKNLTYSIQGARGGT